jgi:hypothetical protein
VYFCFEPSVVGEQRPRLAGQLECDLYARSRLGGQYLLGQEKPRRRSRPDFSFNDTRAWFFAAAFQGAAESTLVVDVD